MPSRAVREGYAVEKNPTPLQKQILGTMVVLARERRQARLENYEHITTADLTERLNRHGQVIGCSCGYMVTYGWLRRMAPSTYAFTRRGLDIVTEAYGGHIQTCEGVPCNGRN